MARSLATLAAIRILVLFAQFWSGRADVRAYHIESTATILAAIAALAWSTNRAGTGTASTATVDFDRMRWAAPALMFCSVALYFTALPVGLLSDDFVHISRARDWQFDAVASYAFRPLAAAQWAVLYHAGAAPWFFHIAIILLHGLVAYLTIRLAVGWLRSWWAAALAGLLMLTFPVGVEPVVWLVNGFENVTMAVLVLTAVLASRRYDTGPTLRHRLLLVGLVFAAVMTKETAAVAGLLILIDAFARRRLGRALWIDAGCLAAAGAIYGIVRLAASAHPSEPISRYGLQRAVFQTFGGLAQQWPVSSRAVELSLAIVGICALMAIITVAVWYARRDTGRVVAAAAGWIFVSILPVFGWILIGPDLRDSRWLYLAAPAWATALAALVTGASSRVVRAITVPAAVIMIALNLVAVRWQIGAWVRAAELRDRVFTAIDANADARACSTIGVTGLPENVDGAYVLLNGAAEAQVLRDAPVRIGGSAGPSCRFRWNGTSIVRAD